MAATDKEAAKEAKPPTSADLHQRLQMCGDKLCGLNNRLVKFQELFYFLCEYDPNSELPGGPLGNDRLEYVLRAILDDPVRRCDLLEESARSFDSTWREIYKLAEEACNLCDVIARMANEAQLNVLSKAELNA